MRKKHIATVLWLILSALTPRIMEISPIWIWGAVSVMLAVMYCFSDIKRWVSGHILKWYWVERFNISSKRQKLGKLYCEVAKLRDETVSEKYKDIYIGSKLTELKAVLATLGIPAPSISPIGKDKRALWYHYLRELAACARTQDLEEARKLNDWFTENLKKERELRSN